MIVEAVLLDRLVIIPNPHGAIIGNLGDWLLIGVEPSSRGPRTVLSLADWGKKPDAECSR